MTSRDRLHKQIQRLSLADKQALQVWLSDEIEAESQPHEMADVPDQEVVETAVKGRITYQLKFIKCGKPNCRCATQDDLHGPYWYGYRKEKGRLKSWYIGKKLVMVDEAKSDRANST